MPSLEVLYSTLCIPVVIKIQIIGIRRISMKTSGLVENRASRPQTRNRRRALETQGEDERSTHGVEA